MLLVMYLKCFLTCSVAEVLVLPLSDTLTVMCNGVSNCISPFVANVEQTSRESEETRTEKGRERGERGSKGRETEGKRKEEGKIRGQNHHAIFLITSQSSFLTLSFMHA